MKQVKPGVQTTEFWMSLAVQLFGVFVFFFPNAFDSHTVSQLNHAISQIVGGIVIAAGALGYGHSRGLAKKNSIQK